MCSTRTENLAKIRIISSLELRLLAIFKEKFLAIRPHHRICTTCTLHYLFAVTACIESFDLLRTQTAAAVIVLNKFLKVKFWISKSAI